MKYWINLTQYSQVEKHPKQGLFSSSNPAVTYKITLTLGQSNPLVLAKVNPVLHIDKNI